MRAPLPYTPANVGEFSLTDVRATIFRNYFFRSTWNGSAYVTDVYRTRADAVAQSSRLATATHGAGFQVPITFTVDGSAPFNPTPMTAIANVAGTYSLAITGWVAEVQAELMDRILAILKNYEGPNEALEGMYAADFGIEFPAVLPCYGVAPAKLNTDETETNRYTGKVGLTLFAAFEGLNAPSVMRDCIVRAERLRSIALDEQITWGGFAMHTVGNGAIEPAVTDETKRVVYSCTLPIEVHIVDLVAEHSPADAGAHAGGKYVVGI